MPLSRDIQFLTGATFLKMHLFLPVVALLSLCSPAISAYTYTTRSLCLTKYGSKSVAPVKTSSYALTIPLTYAAKYTVTPTSTITPAPDTTTVTQTETVCRGPLPGYSHYSLVAASLIVFHFHQHTDTVESTPTNTITETSYTTSTVRHWHPATLISISSSSPLISNP